MEEEEIELPRSGSGSERDDSVKYTERPSSYSCHTLETVQKKKEMRNRKLHSLFPSFSLFFLNSAHLVSRLAFYYPFYFHSFRDPDELPRFYSAAKFFLDSNRK